MMRIALATELRRSGLVRPTSDAFPEVPQLTVVIHTITSAHL